MKTASRYLVLLIVMLFTFFATDGLFAQTWVSLSGDVGSITIASNETKYYRLTGDVAMTGNFSVSGKLTLDLNGYVLKRSNHMNYLIGVLRGGECTVIDSNPNTSHYGKPATIHVYDDDFDYLWEYDASYTASTPDAIEIKGGIITGGIGQTGGAFYVHGTLNLEGGTIAGNFIYCGPFRVKEGSSADWVTKILHPWKFEGQHADYDFNKVINLGTASGGCYIDMNSNEPTGFVNIKGSGGGVWVGPDGTFNMSGGRICYNYAALHGGGVYTSGHFNMTGGLIDHNYALGGYGAGVFIARTKEYEPNISDGLAPDGVMTMDGGEISSNTTWGGSGGGIMAWKGKGTTILTIENGTFQNNQSLGHRAGGLGNGGAIYGEACDMIIKNINVHGNYSGNYGGGIYLWAEAELAMNQGVCNITGNSSKMGGGGICLRHSACSATLGSGVLIEGNTSVTEHGGGFSMKGTSLTIDGAIIRNNHAAQNGGGVYVDINTTINLIGNTEITNNSADGLGGGVYFENSSSLTVGTGTMNIRNNTVAGLPNNIYLSTGKTIAVTGAFDPQYVGIYTQATSTPIKVFTGTQDLLNPVYNGMVDGSKNIFDDKQLYSALYPYNNDYSIYFSNGSPWSPLQQKVTEDDLSLVNGVYQIGNVKQLTAFLWHVNGINDHGSWGTGAPSANGKLTADIDMTGHYWMPIANYTGTFDGEGHVISGLTMVPTNVSTERGLFGVNTSGTIKNVMLNDCYFAGGGSYIGSIVSQMNGGTLYNSVAQCQLLATATTTKAGGLVGHINGGEVHSSVSTCEMTGYTMGGLVGQLTAGNLYNSFANPQFNYSGPYSAPENPDTDINLYVGGLVAENGGSVQNCYVRLERNQSLGSALFGMLAGTNTFTIGTTNYNGTIAHSYAPDGASTQFSHSYTYLNGVTTGLSDCDLYKKVDAPYKYNRPNDNKIGSTDETLTEKLNEWVSGQHDEHPEYAYWKRTTAGNYTTGSGNINDDYPIHKMVCLSNAASPDGLFIEYKYSLNSMLTKYNRLEDGGTVWVYDSPLSAMTASGGTPSYESVSVDNAAKVKLYIDEDASLLQSYDPENTSANNTLTAYTGQTLKTYSTANGNRWHLFSSPLQESQIGISYTNNSEVGFSWSSDPCGVQFSQDNDNALFPSDMPVSAFDLYSFYEPEYHWINFRRNSLSHWHENANEVPIHYNGNGTGGNGNETYLVPGKGYLVSVDKNQLLQNKGVLNNGNVTLQDVTKTNFNAWAGLLGFNLLGNPYQSYLDFEKFINDGTVNNGSNLWEGTSEYNNTYATYDPSQKAYVQYTQNPSQGANTASRYIHPHQGFFVRMTKGGENTNTTTVTYTNAMRTNATDTQSGFRSGESQPAYPLVNFTVRDGDGNADVAVLEIGRDADEGALKMRLGDCTGALSLGHEGKDYGILFRTEVEDYQPLRFEATESGAFTLTWNTANADFERLTLIDNIAGTETDMLSRDSYRFEATSDQYASRFKVVIGDYKGIDEPEPAEGPDESFAFQMGDQLVVNGAGTLQVVDMLGRVVMTERLTSSQNMVGLPKAAGVYVLRLTDGGATRTQKMVVGL